MLIKNIELNNKNITIAVSVAISLAIAWNIMRPLTPEEMQAKIKAEITRLDTQRNDRIASMNKCIDVLKKNI